MKDLKEKSLIFLEESFSKDDFLKEISSYEDIFESIVSLVKNDKQELALKLLDIVLRAQSSSGDLKFEEISYDNGNYSSVYLLYVLKAFANHNEVKFLKKYFKEIRKAISYLNESLDDVYLLNYSLDLRNQKEFLAKDNALFLNIADEMFELLNNVGLNKEAEDVFLLKGKVELGFMRYFWNSSLKKLIFSFNPESQSFKEALGVEVWQIFNRYSVDMDFYKSQLQIDKKLILDKSNLDEVLYILDELKVTKDKDFDKLFKKFLPLFEFFAENVVLEKEFNSQFFALEESLFFGKKISFEILKKQKKVVYNLNSLKICNMILKVLK